MRLCQLLLIGDAELAGDLFEIAGLLVSKTLARDDPTARGGAYAIPAVAKLALASVYSNVNKVVPALSRTPERVRRVTGHLMGRLRTIIFPMPVNKRAIIISSPPMVAGASLSFHYIYRKVWGMKRATIFAPREIFFILLQMKCVARKRNRKYEYRGKV